MFEQTGSGRGSTAAADPVLLDPDRFLDERAVVPADVPEWTEADWEALTARAVAADPDLQPAPTIEAVVARHPDLVILYHSPLNQSATTQLERLAPMPQLDLLPLLRSADSGARRWSATLLAAYPGVATASLIELLGDSDPEVRAAAVESLGRRREDGAAAAVAKLLADDAWFVRVHAARALGEVGQDS